MSGVKDSFVSLDKHPLQLEENVEKLKKALQHWQTWDAEYEALKEEVDAAPEPCTAEHLRKIHVEFEDELLNGKEIDEIFGLQGYKSKHQIINVLQRRIDYVGKNVASLEKQLETAEGKYDTATAVGQPDAVDEQGQPITEIIEQLDDDDNVLSYRLNQPGEALPKVKHALAKASVDGIPSENSVAQHWPDKSTPSLPPRRNDSASRPPKPRAKSPSTSTATEPPPSPSVKKTVSFSEEVETSEPPPAEMSMRAKRVDRIVKAAKEQESISKEKPVIPDDEDAEDAALRQQMLQYSMGEIGAVVAEIDLEEEDASDDDSGFEYAEDDLDDDFDDDDDDDEDRFGRSTGRLVTDKYRQRMLELEQRLGIKSRFTEQAEQNDDDRQVDDQGGIGRIVVNHGTEPVSSASRPAPSKSSIKDGKNGDAEEKKGVRFAQALDVALETKQTAASQLLAEEEAPAVKPLGDIVERTSSTKTAERKSTRKPSRFKKARDENIPKGPFDVPPQYMQQEERTLPTGPKGSTIADTLIEREPTSSVIAPDEFEYTMAHQEVADEYQRMRRKFIQRDGGFLKEDESVIQPLDEADGGEQMSRFKAARLSRQ
ncbi:hypothetical protein QQS21_007492 [Conoideocrella luteorostrata]|uniref:DUF3835 domain-containing protein n=1 Tax=Conoideocrella luteorostrata TaxID=1105319 RepID=A0AAJ0CKS4_9HYPO|nr:hypothetical protein QQS21_007492 [Conoideocrella luteorostrata]